MKKILLIHGWDYDNYYGRINKEAWHNRENFTKELEKKYDIRKPDLPGFGLEKEPNANMYTIDDYADFIHNYIEKNEFNPDYILGYSFGGAVAVTYLKKYGNAKLILVSPALIRNYDKTKKFIKTPKLLNPIRKILKNYYLIHKVKVPEMVYGTKFLRNTYQSIVRVELNKTLEEFNPKDIVIIYGESDNMVNPKEVMETVKPEIRERIHLIPGDHDIANTNRVELMNIIDKFIQGN